MGGVEEEVKSDSLKAIVQEKMIEKNGRPCRRMYGAPSKSTDVETQRGHSSFQDRCAHSLPIPYPTLAPNSPHSDNST